MTSDYMKIGNETEPVNALDNSSRGKFKKAKTVQTNMVAYVQFGTYISNLTTPLPLSQIYYPLICRPFRK